MKRLVVLTLTLLLSLSSTPAHADDVNAGFVQGLWYSSKPVFAGSPTRVYVALRNNTPHDLTGTVVFTDNDKRIGSSPVSALAGRLVEAWADWTPSAGEHTLTASLSNVELHIIGGNTEHADALNVVAKDTLTIEYDTDKDGIGNTADTDDDNDDVSDTDEKARGSDPLVPNPKTTEKPLEETRASEALQPTPAPANSSTPGGAEGLEQYTDAGTVDNLLSNVTDKVETAKQSLDTYRTERNKALSAHDESNVSSSTITPLGTYTSSSTITRSKIETNDTFLGKFVAGVSGILKGIWTFILWGTSSALAHPVFIQLFILIGILYIFYKIARRIGRRPTNL